jgi:nicotinate phosphoribosyltransferase
MREGVLAVDLDDRIIMLNPMAESLLGVRVAEAMGHLVQEVLRHAELQRFLADSTIQLIDTYDTLKGAKLVAELGPPLWGVRIDSGDFLALSRQVRSILDSAGLHSAKIMISGDLDEYRIRELVRAGAPVDSFGVGTQLATSADAPSMSSIYKLVELDIQGIKRFTAKFSQDKPSVPGAKQIFRDVGRDVIARSGECGKGEALLRPVILRGSLVEPLASLEEARARAAESIAKLSPALRELEVAEPRTVIHSRELRMLMEQTRGNLLT